jgi:ABC-type spermidine/putrescine transport system permease subunit II
VLVSDFVLRASCFEFEGTQSLGVKAANFQMESFAARWLRRLALVVVLLGMYLPVAMTFVYSFNASRIGTVWTGFSLQGYATLFQQAALWRALVASCLIAGSASTLSVLAGTMAAVGLVRWQPRWRGVARGVLALPLVTPDVILALSLAMFFSALGLAQGFGTVIAAHCVFGISYAFIVLSGAVGDLDETLYFAALDCGATPWQAYCRVIVPILAPSLVVAWLFVFALSFDDFLITFMTKGPGTDTLPIKIYAQMRFGIQPQTSALFVILFLTTLSGAVLARRLRTRVSGEW